jgi:transitional endoplasmic reticulum ATPase
LDPASLRRFLVKLRFNWLTTAQARIAFRQFFGVGPPLLDGLRTVTKKSCCACWRRKPRGAEMPASKSVFGRGVKRG